MNGKTRKPPTEIGPPKWNVPMVLLAVMALILLATLWSSDHVAEEIPYSEFQADVNSGKVANVVISDTKIIGEYKAPQDKAKKYFSVVPVGDRKLIALLQEKGVVFRGEVKSPLWSSLLSWLVPLFILFGLWSVFMKRADGGGGPRGIFGLAKARARVYVERDTKTTFADVAGCDEAKAELKEVVSFLEDPKKYSRLGGRAPKGILLVGPPGTGKTLLARALAGEAKVPFLSINGSEFVEMFVGLGAARVRDIFEQSRGMAPCILFIDEIDALGKARGPGVFSGGHEEKEQTLNQLLAEMDGFDASEGVIILAATNRPETLDPALLRAGRFDRQVLVNIPDKVGRTQILKVHTKHIQLDPGVVLEHVAALTPGFSGADLANLVNEAAIFATRREGNQVTEKDFTLAIERLVAGLEQKSRLINPEEKRRIAYHEMGHATSALALRSGDKVHKVSIIPRGLGALGYTLQRPTEDRYLMDRTEMLRKIAVLLGGRASETLFFPEVSTGAADDLAKATDIARAMVTQYGMSQELGLATFEERGSQFLSAPYQLHERRPFSEETSREIDREVKSILEHSFRMSRETLTANQDFIEAGARRLLEIETIDEDDLLKLWGELGNPGGQESPSPVVPLMVPRSNGDGVKTGKAFQGGSRHV